MAERLPGQLVHYNKTYNLYRPNTVILLSAVTSAHQSARSSWPINCHGPHMTTLELFHWFVILCGIVAS